MCWWSLGHAYQSPATVVVYIIGIRLTVAPIGQQQQQQQLKETVAAAVISLRSVTGIKT